MGSSMNHNSAAPGQGSNGELVGARLFDARPNGVAVLERQSNE